MGTERYHPLVAVDLRNACQHYDAIACTLGNRFRTSVQTKIQAIVERPESFGHIGGDFRGAMIIAFHTSLSLPSITACRASTLFDTPHLIEEHGLIER